MKEKNITLRQEDYIFSKMLDLIEEAEKVCEGYLEEALLVDDIANAIILDWFEAYRDNPKGQERVLQIIEEEICP
jgi:hypothetical protein